MPDVTLRKLKDRQESRDCELLQDKFEAFGTSTHTFYFESHVALYKHRDGLLGYLLDEKKRYSIAWGDPLVSAYARNNIIDSFNTHCITSGLSPLWMNVNRDVADFLESKSYTVLSCAHEDLMNPMVFQEDAKLRQMRARARRHGCSISKYDSHPGAETAERMQDCIKQWQGQRSGPQCFSTTVEPFLMRDRIWFTATSQPDGAVIDGFVTLQKLRAHRSWSIEHCIISPKAPKGTSEELLYSAIECLKIEGCTALSFGISAASELKILSGISGMGATGLSLLYKTVMNTFKLGGRSKFRSKFGVKHAPAYVCLPPGCDWLSAGKAILQTVHAEV